MILLVLIYQYKWAFANKATTEWVIGPGVSRNNEPKQEDSPVPKIHLSIVQVSNLGEVTTFVLRERERLHFEGGWGLSINGFEVYRSEINSSSLLWHPKKELWWINRTKRPNAPSQYIKRGRQESCIISCPILSHVFILQQKKAKDYKSKAWHPDGTLSWFPPISKFTVFNPPPYHHVCCLNPIQSH